MIPGKRLFRSFWSGGFECSCQINSNGVRLDMMAGTQHDICAAADYRMLCDAGIRTARDGLRWHLIDRGGRYDWSSWLPMLKAARDEKIQVIWDLFHYGWPDDLDIFSSEFVERFAAFANQAAKLHREVTGETPFFSPVNEISFFTWAATRGLMFPYAEGRDTDLKRQLVMSQIAAIQAIWDVAPEARIVSPDPLIHTMPPVLEPWNIGPALEQRNSQFEAWDMIAGRAAPELKGQEKYLDIIGLNFYAANQWEVPGGRKLHWDAGSDDPRWMPLHLLLAEVHQRYQRPLYLAETSHYGIGRADWLNEVSAEIQKAIGLGVPVEGACLYPILDRFDWEDPSHWHHSGLWDMSAGRTGCHERILNQPYVGALRQAQTVLE